VPICPEKKKLWGVRQERGGQCRNGLAVSQRIETFGSNVLFVRVLIGRVSSDLAHKRTTLYQ